MRLLSPVAAVLLFFGGASITSAEFEESQWLDRMSSSHREVNYRGIVAYQVDSELSSFRINHSVIDGREYELVEPLDSAGTALVKRGHSLKCVHPAEQLIRAAVNNSKQPIEGINRYYELALTGRVLIAGREGVVMQITPRDAYRIGYRLALDVETALPLKSVMLDQRGEVLERFQFTLVETGVAPMTPEQLSYAREINDLQPLAQEQQQAILEQLNWHPGWIPDGFQLTRVVDGDADALSYSDGLAMFSVFLEPNDDQSPAHAGAMRHGATVAYTYLVPDRPFVVTVVGEVPVLTARQVAQSVSWIQ